LKPCLSGDVLMRWLPLRPENTLSGESKSIDWVAEC
jgi:hypothetical protein